MPRDCCSTGPFAPSVTILPVQSPCLGGVSALPYPAAIAAATPVAAAYAGPLSASAALMAEGYLPYGAGGGAVVVRGPLGMPRAAFFA